MLVVQAEFVSFGSNQNLLLVRVISNGVESTSCHLLRNRVVYTHNVFLLGVSRDRKSVFEKLALKLAITYNIAAVIWMLNRFLNQRI